MWHTKAGSEEDPNFNKWVKACILQSLPDKVVTHLALELKHADSIEEMQNLVNTVLHDHRIGMLRVQPGPVLYFTETPDTEESEEVTNNYETQANNYETSLKRRHPSKQKMTKTMVICTQQAKAKEREHVGIGGKTATGNTHARHGPKHKQAHWPR